ncbi:MAG: AAA family ATPase [Desulfovibrionaceae bacterium]|nr:AAA family ATPase [Desulfovibrionaceae bacterium]
MSDNFRLYIGGEDFHDLIKNGCYYVDKTAYLKNIFMGKAYAKVHLFLRPRRFGKTLNLNMIKAFCQLNYEHPGDKHYQEKSSFLILNMV